VVRHASRGNHFLSVCHLLDVSFHSGGGRGPGALLSVQANSPSAHGGEPYQNYWQPNIHLAAALVLQVRKRNASLARASAMPSFQPSSTDSKLCAGTFVSFKPSVDFPSSPGIETSETKGTKQTHFSFIQNLK
jgi:hypothetical protein